MAITPYIDSQDNKKSQVASMFNNIAKRYDFLNRFLSLGIDQYWRKKTLDFIINNDRVTKVLDIATGTADLAIKYCHKTSNTSVVGADISSEMLAIAAEKIKSQKLESRIQLIQADSEHLVFDADSFDAVMVAFGVRNYGDLELGLREMKRVLKPGGTMLILEFSKPRVFPIKQIFQFYFRFILPVIGKIISKDQRAYTYLFESVQHFPDFERFEQKLKEIGMKNTSFHPLTFGICNIYLGIK